MPAFGNEYRQIEAGEIAREQGQALT